MKHEMRLDAAPFAAIARGDKTVEMRLYDEKRRRIALGDEILFCERGTDRTLSASVVALHRFPTFRELYAALPLTSCGYTPEEVATASPADMERYYSLAEQERYGVLGIEIRRKGEE